MFKKNTRHLQIPLTSHVDEMPEPLRKRLHNSWAETFYREFFSRLDEKPFEVLAAGALSGRKTGCHHAFGGRENLPADFPVSDGCRACRDTVRLAPYGSVVRR